MIKGISIFLPAYNDEKTIKRLVLDVISVLDPLNLDYEIIIIDGCSQDATGEIAKGLTENHKNVKLVQHKKNMGYGGALKSGFANATKEWVFYTDSDGQYDIREILRLLPYTQEYDFINGNISKRMDPIYRIILGRIYQFWLDIFFGRKLRYVNCDFRLIKKSIIDQITIDSNSGFAPAEIVIKLFRNGARIKEVLVSHFTRQQGRSQFFKLKKLINLFTDFLKFFIHEKLEIFS